MSSILLLNGPNLGALGRREPGIYGTRTLEEITGDVVADAAEAGWDVVAVQSDSEGDLVRAVHEHSGTLGAIVNPGALMIYGWSLRDALASYPSPWVEVHLSNIWARESFRHESVLAPLASGLIAGLGADGYRLAVRALTALVPAGGPR